MSSSRVRHPILRLDVLAPDGTMTSEHRVFCRLQRQSVRVDACCGCVHCEAVTDGQAPTVDCLLPVKPLAPRDDPSGESVEVGTLLCRGTMVLADTTGVGRALGLLRDEDRRSVAIVDANKVLVGLIHDAGFSGRVGASRSDNVGAVMSSVIAVSERTPVRVALKLLAASHLREATVVSKEGVPIGVFRDVDGLHWLAEARSAAGRDDPDE